MAPRQQSEAQRNRSAIANKISKSCNWSNARPNRRPRGLGNSGNTCYRNATLQPLLHLPRFMNWILRHKEWSQNWPCGSAPTATNRSGDLNQAPNPQFKDDPAIVELGDEGMGCVPCLLKNLIQGYWGRDVLIDGRNGRPDPLPTDHPSWHQLQQLSRRWFYRDSYGLSTKLGRDANKDKTPAEIDTMKYRARREEMDGQQDADEYLRLILNGIEETYERWDADRNILKRAKEYDSLFTRTAKVTLSCQQCDRTWDDSALIHELGFRIHPAPLGTPDSIPAAIARSMRVHDSRPCRFCSRPGVEDDDDVNRPVVSSFEIVAAPEYLLIHNNCDRLGDKNRNPLEIPSELDITQYMTYGSDPNPVPVRYGLRHVVYHAGSSLRYGHYASSVTGLPALPFKTTGEKASKFFCNDTTVTDFTHQSMPGVNDVLTANPVITTSSEFDFYMAWYVRLPNGESKAQKSKAAAKARAKVATPLPDEGGIAGRIKSAPRVRRARRL